MIKLYIETSLKGPQIQDGWYAYILECETKKGKATVGEAGNEKESTYNRTTLLAITKALERIKTPENLENFEIWIYTYCTFIKNTYERGQPEVWKRQEWTKPSGEDVKNKELWQQFLEEVERLGGRGKIGFRFSKHNDYRELMQEMIEKNRSEKPDKR